MSSQDIGVIVAILGFVFGVIRFEMEAIQRARERAESLKELQTQSGLLREQVAMLKVITLTTVEDYINE